MDRCASVVEIAQANSAVDLDVAVRPAVRALTVGLPARDVLPGLRIGRRRAVAGLVAMDGGHLAVVSACGPPEFPHQDAAG